MSDWKQSNSYLFIEMFSQEMLFIGNVLITALVSPQWSSTILNWCQQMQDTTIVGLVKGPLANQPTTNEI